MRDLYEVIRFERHRLVKEREADLSEAADAFLKKYALRLLLGDVIEVADIREENDAPVAPELLANYLITADSSCAFKVTVYTLHGERFYYVSTDAR